MFIVMMTEEGYTKIVTFMTPGAAVLVLGRDHISFKFILKGRVEQEGIECGRFIYDVRSTPLQSPLPNH